MDFSIKNFLQSKNITIGAAIIVKDSSATIEHTIGSIKNICSQIVVVDTGSSDYTPELCTNLGCEVHFKKWSDDFSESRNYALKVMRSDWILSVDSDEIVDETSFETVSDYFTNPNIGGIRVKILNYINPDELSNTTEHRYTRIYRNNPKLHYTGKVHEQIHESILEQQLSIVDSEILIKHFGYLEITDDKNERNKKLLQEDIKTSEKDDWKLFHLGSTEFSSNNIDKAKEIFLNIVDSDQLSIEQNETIRIKLSQIALKEDNFEDLGKWANFKSEDPSREGFRLYLIATAFLVRKEFDEAAKLYSSELVKTSSLVDKNQLKKALDIINMVNSFNK